MWATTTQSGGVHGGNSFAPDLGLKGVPTQSLIEFEGGGSMLSREILGEMLATNEAGVLNAPGDTAGAKRGRVNWSKQQRGAAVVEAWTQEHGLGSAEESKRGHELCRQNYALLPSQSKSSIRSSVDRSRSKTASWTGRRQNVGGTNGCGGQHQGGYPSARSKVGHKATGASTPSVRVDLPSFGVPCKRVSSPVKLYDHDHNPRFLRALVDESTAARIATGRGDLRTNKEALRTDRLRKRLCFAHNISKETPEKKLLKSLGGPAHREVLRELDLDRMRNALIPRRKEQAESMSMGSKVEAKLQDTMIDFGGQQESTATVGRYRSRRCRLYSINEQGDQSTESGVFMVQNRVTSPTYPHEVPRFFDSDQKHLSDWFLTRNSEKHPLGRSLVESGEKRWTQTSGGLITCNQPLFCSLTPTYYFRRYLSSPRPSSADYAQAAWGEREAARDVSSAGPLKFPYYFATVEESAPRWPVLFVVGSSRPPTRHPLSLHALPLFDDDMINLLAQASGEPKRKVRAMARVLAGLDLRLLQASVKRLCCAYTAGGAQVGIPSSSYIGGRQVQGSSGLVPHAWVRSTKKSSATRSISIGPRHLMEREEIETNEQSLILPKESAKSAITSGFLTGVFGDDTVRDILHASSFFVLYDSICSQQEHNSIPPASSPPPPLPQEDVDNGRGERMSQQRRTTRQAGDATDVMNTLSEVSQETRAAVFEERGERFSMRRPERLLIVDRPDMNDRAQSSGNPVPLSNDGPNGAVSQTANMSGRMSTAHEEHKNKVEEGVFLVPLVRAVAIKFRIHNLAVRHRGSDGGGDVEDTGVSCSDCRESLDLATQERTFVPRMGASRTLGEEISVDLRGRRPASTAIIDLGLPPTRRDKKGRPQQALARPFTSTAWVDEATPDGRGRGGREKGTEEGSGGIMHHIKEKRYEEASRIGLYRQSSTPRCLRPDFKVLNKCGPPSRCLLFNGD